LIGPSRSLGASSNVIFTGNAESWPRAALMGRTKGLSRRAVTHSLLSSAFCSTLRPRAIEISRISTTPPLQGTNPVTVAVHRPFFSTSLDSLLRSRLRPPFSAAALRRSCRPLRAMPSTVESIQWPAAKVRQTFLDYFKKRGHTFGMLLLISSMLLDCA
jgi:hypothetical protein